MKTDLVVIVYAILLLMISSVSHAHSPPEDAQVFHFKREVE